jgi:peptide subunit release factor RF-3
LLDRDDNPVVLFKSEWAMKWAIDNQKSLNFLTTAPLKVR